MKVLKLRENAMLPKYATEQAVGADLTACLDAPLTVQPGETVRIPTGLAVDPERDDVGLFLYARSGLSTKHGLGLANGVGVVDPDYRGEIQVAVYNHSATAYTIQPGERIAQLVVQPILRVEWEEAQDLSETARGAGGFGSTGGHAPTGNP